MKIILITLMFLLAIFCKSVLAQEEREYNNLEWDYYQLAAASGNPEMCYKISPKATYPLIFNPAPYQAAYLRSVCFLDAAVGSKNKSLCSEVKTRSVPMLDGSGYSEENCIKEMDNPYSSRGGGCVDQVDELLKAMGYTREDLLKYGVTEKDFNCGKVFFKCDKTPPEFKEKLKSLPDFSQ